MDVEVPKQPPNGAFVALFSPNLEKVLVVKHAYKDRKVSLPGGGIEIGENALVAAAREVEEETGFVCRISPATFVGTFFLTKSLGAVFLYVGEIIGGQPNGSTDEIARSFFMPIKDVDATEVYPAQCKLIQHALAWVREARSFRGRIRRLFRFLGGQPYNGLLVPLAERNARSFLRSFRFFRKAAL